MEHLVVRSLEDFDVVYTNSGMTDFGHRLARRLGLPHVWHLREFGRPDYGVDFVVGRDAAIRTIRSADAVVTNSRALRIHFFGNDQKIEVIPNGVVWASDIAVEGRSFPRERPFVFLIAGVIRPEKGQIEAVRALAQLRKEHPQVRLIIAGDGEMVCRCASCGRSA